MRIASMHYDFKQKLNKIDSQGFRNLEVPEIDWKLNEAQEVFIKIIADPRFASEIGFEGNQRTIEDIRVLVINQKSPVFQPLTLYDIRDSSYIAPLPTGYFQYVNSTLKAKKGECEAYLETTRAQHDDRVETSVFDKSSFLWRHANIRFNEDGIRVFTGNGDFTPLELYLEYIRIPDLMHNAGDWDPGGYTVDGVTLTGTADCTLPDTLHREIVDLAVMIAAGDLSIPNYQFRRAKVAMVERKENQ